MNNSSVIDWLLEEENPSLRYRTLTELLDENPQKRSLAPVRAAIARSPAVTAIVDKMHPEGYWLQTNPRNGEVTGDGVAYGAFATTHFCLAYLAELGLTRDHPAVALAADRYLNLQAEDGDFWNHYSCLFGLNIRTFIMLGYREDPRVQKTIELMLRTERSDGGYLCDMHEGKYKTKPTKSCIRGAVKALLAFSELPELWDHPRCEQLVEYFMRREGLYRMDKPQLPVHKDMVSVYFPITWRASLVELLLAMSRMGLGRRRKLSRAWQVLNEKKDPSGRYILDWNPVQAPLKPGKRGAPNKWITFYALLALKLRKEG